MLKQLLTLIIIANAMCLFAQTYEGDVLLETQADVNEFGANNYKIINGNLQINGGDHNSDEPITDLSPLNSIEEVNYLAIGELYGITDTLTGFENLKTVKGTLRFNLDDEGESQMKAMNAFNKLESVYEDLSITVLEGLEEIKGFNSLEEIGGYFSVEGNKLKRVSGFGNLKSIAQYAIITNMPELESFKGFESLKVIESLTFGANPKLASLDGFNKLEVIAKDLTIYENPELTSISGFNALAALGFDRTDGATDGTVTVRDNAKLKRIDGFNNLQACDAITITQNALLEELTGFGGLVDATTNPDDSLMTPIESYIIVNAPNLSKCEAFENTVKCYSMSFDIPKMDNVDFLCKLEELVAIDGNQGNVTITAGPSLDNCYALCNIPAVQEYKVSITGGSGGCAGVLQLIEYCKDSANDSCTDGVSDESAPSQFALYPNPTNGIVNIKDARDGLTIQIYSLDGRCLETRSHDGLSMIDMSSYRSGVYTVHIIENESNKKEVHKVVKY